MLKLDTVEQSWLNDYRQALDSDFPDLVEDIVIFGSKARGDAGPDSDLDVLVVIREADRQTALLHGSHSHLWVPAFAGTTDRS